MSEATHSRIAHNTVLQLNNTDKIFEVINENTPTLKYTHKHIHNYNLQIHYRLT